MSEQKSNVCAICGGLTRISYTIEFRECMPHSIAVDPNPVVVPQMRLCTGHPEPAPKHDGDLGEGDRVSLWRYTERHTDVLIERECGSEDNKHLSPKQALSLRDWLIQESPTLEKLAKEQEE